MGYKLNRQNIERKKTAAYHRAELELMSEQRLREICKKRAYSTGLYAMPEIGVKINLYISGLNHGEMYAVRCINKGNNENACLVGLL